MVRQSSEVIQIAQKVVALVKRSFPVKAAYLFGSYTDGTCRDDSDIDIAIFCDKIDTLDADALMDFMGQIQKEVGVDEIELHLFHSSMLQEMRPTNFFGYISSHGLKIAA